MKKLVIAVIAAVSGLNVMVGAAELSGLKAGDVAALMSDTQITLPAVAEKARGVSSKIVITPTTANWKDTMLVKFAKNTGIDVVMYVLDSVDLSPANFADNGDGYLVRVDIKDADAALRAAKLAGFRAVETVQVNRTVYAMLSSFPKSIAPKGAPAVHLLRMSSVLASGRLPGGCVVENNSFRPAPNFPMGDDTLNLGITSGGRYMDMLLVGDVQYREDDRSETFKYESVSTQGADWVDHRVKNVLELRVENGSPVAFTVVKYKESKNLFGGTSWKETDSMVCR